MLQRTKPEKKPIFKASKCTRSIACSLSGPEVSRMRFLQSAGIDRRRSGAESGSPIGRCAEIESSAAMLSSASTSRLQYLRPAKHPLVVKARYTAWITIPRRNWTNSSLPPTHSPTGRVLNLEKNNTRNPSTLLSFTRKT